MLIRSARCSSLYQRLKSGSLSAGTSHHTMSRPAPFLFFAISHLPRRPRGLREGAARGRVRLERAPETQLLADLAHGGQHFLAEEPDARARVGRAHEAVVRPEAHDRRPRLFEEAADLRDDRLR